MEKFPFLVIGKVILLLTLVPLPTNAFAALMSIITDGPEILTKAIDTYNALEELHKEVVQTGVETLTPGQGAALQRLDSIYWDLTDLKNDVANWQAREEQKEIAGKIDDLLNKVDKINQKYEIYERFRFNNSFIVNNVRIKAEPDRIKNFAESVISYDIGELPDVIKDMHKTFTGVGAMRDSVLSKLSEKKGDLMCVRNQSAQQFILELLRAIIDADKKGLILKLFAFDELAKYKDNGAAHYYEYSRITEQEEFVKRIDTTLEQVKKQLAKASREVWRCDPQKHVKGDTYTKIQEVFQTYAYFERDYFNNLCQQRCPQFNKLVNPRCKTKFCQKHSERKRCHGRLKDCQKIHKTQRYCFASETSDRRYEWMYTGSNTTYGPYDVGCEDVMDVDESQSATWFITQLGSFPMYSDCDTCLCTCVSEEQDIDRYFSLKPVFADVHQNMVVTGIRFVKNGHILSLQIQQGKLAPNGSVDPNTLNWKNESVSAGYGLYTVGEERQNVFLDDILSPSENNENQHDLHEEFVVSGVKLEEMDNSLRLKVSFVPYNYTTGTIYNYSLSSHRFYGNDKHKDKRTKLSLAESADPTKTYANVLDSTHQQRVEFQLSGLVKDLGQSTIPYIDIQDVVSSPPVPLVGLGLMHKGAKGYGGFLAFKLIQYDYTPHI